MNKQQATKIFLTAATFLAVTSGWAGSQSKYKLSDTESIEQQLTWAPNSEITVFNVYGSIEVVGHDGDVIEIAALNKVWAANASDVQMGLDEIGIKAIQNDKGTFVYLDSPFTHYEPETGDVWHSDTCVHRHDCSVKYTEKKPYQYHMNMQLRIPKQASIEVSAINGGDINIKNVQADNLNISNINGAIEMLDVSGKTHVNAINKDINIRYSKNPLLDSVFESINGDLSVTFAQPPNAKVVYETMNGSMYSKYEYQNLPSEVEITTAKEGNKHGNKYRISANHPIQLGEGGPTYTFKTLNGDIKIK